MSEYQLTINLKQQTPYIHFQHNQTGATLRATEVKPKLDKFLIEKLGSNVKESWFIGYKKDKKNDNKTALDYKMRFHATGEVEISEAGDYRCKAISHPKNSQERKDAEKMIKEQINPMYFGNMVKGERDEYTDNALETKKKEIKDAYKETVFYKDDIVMTIICYSDLLKKIEENIVEFFLVNNFGCRQSKGFGGFIVNEINGITFTYDKDVIQEKLNNRMCFYTQVSNGSYDDLMNHAMVIYGMLKGGYNFTFWKDEQKKYIYPERYIKSYIQRAFLDEAYPDKKTGSEKAFIKGQKQINRFAVLNRIREEYDQNNTNYDGYTFIRIMLGMADTYKFTSLRKGEINVYNLGNDSLEIVRFKSPITIKIIKNFIFFIIDESAFGIMKNKRFHLLDTSRLSDDQKKILSKGDYSSKKNLISKKAWVISTPKEFGEYEIKLMIKGFVEYFNNNKHKLGAFENPYNASKNLSLFTEVN